MIDCNINNAHLRVLSHVLTCGKKIAEDGLNYDKICLKSVSINHISFLCKTGVNKPLHLYWAKEISLTRKRGRERSQDRVTGMRAM